MTSVRHIGYSVSALVTLTIAGTAGYALIEGWPLLDALYMTVITLGTVGFREVYELSDRGKIFTILLIIFGAGILAYTIGSIAQFMVEGQLKRFIGRRKVEKQIDQLRDHYIVCGFGRIGSIICRELADRPVPFVIIERQPHTCERIEREGYLYIAGNATEDDILMTAGIERARGLITVVSSDTDNVYITLTARGLKPDLFILARAGEEGSEKKLARAGASKVISPYTIGATRMAQAVLRPSVVDFIEIATAGQNLELQIEEIRIAPESRLAGLTLAASGIRKDHGLIIVGIRNSGGMLFNPGHDAVLAAGDTLIALGPQPAISHLERIAASRA